MNSMADYWGLLTEKDKEFILEILKRDNPEKYRGYHVAHLILMKFRTVKYAVRKAKPIRLSFWQGAPDFAHDRLFRAAKKRVLKRLSPELLLQEQQRKWREQQKRKRELSW